MGDITQHKLSSGHTIAEVENILKTPERLLPCPFCGQNAELTYGEHDYNVFEVICRGCNASAGWDDNPDKAKSAWNRRANSCGLTE